MLSCALFFPSPLSPLPFTSCTLTSWPHQNPHVHKNQDVSNFLVVLTDVLHDKCVMSAAPEEDMLIPFHGREIIYVCKISTCDIYDVCFLSWHFSTPDTVGKSRAVTVELQNAIFEDSSQNATFFSCFLLWWFLCHITPRVITEHHTGNREPVRASSSGIGEINWANYLLYTVSTLSKEIKNQENLKTKLNSIENQIQISHCISSFFYEQPARLTLKWLSLIHSTV